MIRASQCLVALALFASAVAHDDDAHDDDAFPECLQGAFNTKYIGGEVETLQNMSGNDCCSYCCKKSRLGEFNGVGPVPEG
jgi:hypothetical protein